MPKGGLATMNKKKLKKNKDLELFVRKLVKDARKKGFSKTDLLQTIDILY